MSSHIYVEFDHNFVISIYKKSLKGKFVFFSSIFTENATLYESIHRETVSGSVIQDTGMGIVYKAYAIRVLGCALAVWAARAWQHY